MGFVIYFALIAVINSSNKPWSREHPPSGIYRMTGSARSCFEGRMQTYQAIEGVKMVENFECLKLLDEDI